MVSGRYFYLPEERNLPRDRFRRRGAGSQRQREAPSLSLQPAHPRRAFTCQSTNNRLVRTPAQPAKHFMQPVSSVRLGLIHTIYYHACGYETPELPMQIEN